MAIVAVRAVSAFVGCARIVASAHLVKAVVVSYDVIRTDRARLVISYLYISTSAQGLHEITTDVDALVRAAGVYEGLCTMFLRHTSASLLIQENADPSARRDLERWLNRLVPEEDALYTHRAEGTDDMPSHIKSALTAVTLSVPVIDGRLGLGVWQGIYVWEHRRRGSRREIVVHVGT